MKPHSSQPLTHRLDLSHINPETLPEQQYRQNQVIEVDPPKKRKKAKHGQR